MSAPYSLTRRTMLCGIGAPLVLGAVPSAFARTPDVLSGVIRVCGSPRMRELMSAWAKGFNRLYPNVYFDVDLKGTATAQFGIQQNIADIALSARQAATYEQYGIIRRGQLLPIEIAVATGSHDKIGKAAALAIFVHRDNPIAGLSIEQLDGIFGDQRAGGWGAIAWETKAARGPEKNIRTWGQLGLKGEWADKPIIPYAPPAAHPGGVSYFQRRVMGGADTVNEKTREYPDRKAMIADLAKDRFGVGYASLGYAAPGVRAIPVSDGPAGKLVGLTRASVADRSYPLSRYAYIYLSPDNAVGDAVLPEPRVLAFLEFVLGRQGQMLVSSTDYHPLPTAIADEQKRKLHILAEPIGADE